MISSQGTKIIVLVVLFVSTFIFSMLPVKFTTMARNEVSLIRKRRLQIVMSLLSCYAAGVFLATCLLDLFPDVQEKMSYVFDQANILSSYPVSEFIMTVGMFIILLVEQIVLTYKGDEEEEGLSEPLLGTRNGNDAEEFRHSCIQATSVNNINTPNVASNGEGRSNYQENGEFGNTDSRNYAEEYHYVGPSDDTKSVDYQDPNSHSVVRALLLLTALSLHSIFEGLAVGLQGTSRQVLQIFAALALHKSILAFSLGMNLGQSRLSLGAIIRSNLLFSVTSPVGIGIGITIDDLTTANSIPALLTNGILQGLACGTFLFIVFFEVLPHEFNSQRAYPSRLLKVLLLILGYSTVAGLLFINPTVVRPSCQKGSVPAI